MPPLLRRSMCVRRSRPSRRAAMLPGVVMLAACLVAAAPAAPARAQALAQPGMADSVVSRLVAWRARSQAPVALPALTGFDWDHFSVIDSPAGDAIAQCGRAGLMPCGPELHPQPGDRVQVLRFERAGAAIYSERIVATDGAFAEPLPMRVPRSAATLVSCTASDGRALWCLQGRAAAKPGVRAPQPFLDGA